MQFLVWHIFLSLFELWLKISKSASMRRVSAAFWIIEPFGEIGANILYNFHREHSLLNLVLKMLSPKINVKNIKLEFS